MELESNECARKKGCLEMEVPEESVVQREREGTQAREYTAPFWEWIYNWFGGHTSAPSQRIGGAR